MNHNGLPLILKFLRGARGLTQEQLAERLNVSTSLVAKFETGRLVPMRDTAKTLDTVLESGEIVFELSDKARKGGAPDWFQPWPEVEREATSLRGHEPNWLPGLLQTEAYARAVLRAGLFTADEAEDQLALRLERQAAVFGRERPPVCTFVIDELALLRGDPALMKDQLEHLVALSTQPLVFIHVVPRSAGLYVGQSGPLVLASISGGDVAYLEDQADGRVITDPDRVAGLVRVWDAVRSMALPRDMSRDLITRMAKEL